MAKSNLLQIRLTDKEKQAFEESAAISGISLSDWVRQHLRRAAIQEMQQIGKRAVFLPDIPLRSHGN